MLLVPLSGFLIGAAIVFFAGRKLAYYGDLLAQKTGWGKAWVGLILMATVTSLPELMAGISSSAIVMSADLAVGDILGSCAFNLGILAMLDAYLPRNQPLFSQASPNHVLSAAFGIILIGMAGFSLILPEDILLISWIGTTSVLFIIIYVASIRLIYKNEHNHLHSKNKRALNATSPNPLSLRRVSELYTLFAVIIILSALSLPYFADDIAEAAGLDKSFVGTLMLATSTSLPEVAVSIAAIRLRSVDLAVGGLLGSNIFNIFILALDDAFYTKGHLMKDASDIHLFTAFAAIIMSAIVIIGLTYRASGKRFLLAWDAALIFLIYIANIILLYNLT